MTNKSKNFEAGSPGYDIEIVGRNVQVTEAMKTYAREKLSKIEKLHNHILQVHVTMDIEHLLHKVVIIAKLDHFKVKAHGESTDMYASVDMAVDRLQKQLYRWKDRIQDHSRKGLSGVDLEVFLLEKAYSNEIDEYNLEIEAANAKQEAKSHQLARVVGKKKISLKELNTDEAVVKMELSHDPFLVYRSEEDHKLKVMYRRKDGNYGIIQPE